MSLALILLLLALVFAALSLAIPNRLLLPASVMLICIAAMIGKWGR